MTTCSTYQLSARRWFVMAAVVFVVAVSDPAGAEIVTDGSTAPEAAREVLDRVAQAVRAGDHVALASLVHPDGIRLSMGPDPERISELTAAQAHYYFKALFQSQRTERFEFLRRRTGDRERVFATATWRSTRTDTGDAVVTRLLVTLAFHDSGWRITELAALRGG